MLATSPNTYPRLQFLCSPAGTASWQSSSPSCSTRSPSSRSSCTLWWVLGPVWLAHLQSQHSLEGTPVLPDQPTPILDLTGRYYSQSRLPHPHSCGSADDSHGHTSLLNYVIIKNKNTFIIKNFENYAAVISGWNVKSYLVHLINVYYLTQGKCSRLKAEDISL